MFPFHGPSINNFLSEDSLSYINSLSLGSCYKILAKMIESNPRILTELKDIDPLNSEVWYGRYLFEIVNMKVDTLLNDSDFFYLIDKRMRDFVVYDNSGIINEPISLLTMIKMIKGEHQ